MHLAILQCDDLRAPLVQSHHSYSRMIQNWLRAFGSDLEFTTFDLHKHQLPQDLQAFAGWIITGSAASVYEDLDWIAAAVSLTQRLQNQQQKVFGICFGHQLLALANQQHVARAQQGWGIGVSQPQASDLSEWQALQQSVWLVSHQDQVITLPETASLLAGNDFCPNFFVQWQPGSLSLQGHPEWSVAFARELLLTSSEPFPEALLQRALQQLDSMAEEVEHSNRELGRALLDWFMP